jgi:hypothetical protein
VPIIEELKAQLENSTEQQAQTQKNINEIKRNSENIYVDGEEPVRTWNSISKGIVSL